LFTFFSKTIRRAKADLRKTSKGQVAIVLILMTALAIIIYASTLNLGRVAELKTLTTIAADVSAAQMASNWASYAEQLYQIHLGGESETKSLTVCGMGPMVQLFISLIIIVAALIITIVCWGTCAGFTGLMVAAAIAALALSIGAILLQVLVLDPGITAMWTKLMENLPAIDQFLERGIMAGLQNAVNDPILVPDLHDTDSDGLFGFDALKMPKDRVNRFGLYFTRRLQKMEIAGNPSVKAFKAALTTFMDSFWEIPNCSVNPLDPCCGTNPPAECNPCCQPIIDPRTGHPLRPSCCDGMNPEFSSCGSSANCGASSEYGPPYLPLYDPYYEKFPNNSFRGKFGLDDEHRFFHTEPLNDHSRRQVPETDMHLDADGVSRKIFRFDDAKSAAVFPIFWKFSDWGVDLGQLTLDATDNYKKYECHLCDPRFLPAHAQCNDISPLLSLPGTLAGPLVAAGGLSPQLSLPNAPGNYNGGNCVFDPRDPRDIDRKKILRPDMVKTLEDLIVFPESRTATDCGEIVGKWKRGTDLYCSTTWPYSIGCEKAGGYTCTDRDGHPGFPCFYPCGHTQAGNPAMWPDDPFDDFMRVSKAFAIWAQSLVDMDDALAQRDFKIWYPEFLNWLSPDGELMQWRNEMQRWSDKINNWLNTASFRGSDADEALCVPPAGTTGIANTWPTREVGTPNGQPPGLKQSEAATFGNGHLNDVRNCLQYNIDNIPRFTACGDGADSCNEANCSNLPRSVLVNAGPTSSDYFDTNDFVVPRDPDVTAFAVCLANCSTSNCNKPPLPVSPTPWQGPAKGPVIPKYKVDEVTFIPPDTVRQNQLLSCRAAWPTPGSCPTCQKPCNDARDQCSQERSDCGKGCHDRYDGCLPGCHQDLSDCLQSCNNSHPCETRWTDCYALCSCQGFNCPANVDKNCNMPHPFHPSCAADYNDCIASCSGDPFDSGTQICFKRCSGSDGYDGCLSANGCTFQAALDATGGTCFSLHWNPGDPYYQAVANSWAEAKGSCFDGATGFPRKGFNGVNYTDDWQPKLQKAAIEAQNQQAKLQKRRDFLAARMAEIQSMKNFFDPEIAQMDTLLEAAKKVIDAKITNQKQHSLAGFAIYGWKGEPAPGATRGQWHIVRVDTREPQRCNGNCGKAGSPEPDLPTIKTYTLPAPPWVTVLFGPIGLIPGWTRCFSLGDVFDKYSGCDEKKDYGKARHCFKGGVVKAQVIRWDENQQQLTFPGKFNLWKFIFNHPLAPGGVPSANDLDTICPHLDEAPGAFMLNRAPDDSDDHQCWDKANRLLEHGVMSRACAEYYYHDKTPKGFNLKFSNCPPGEF